MAQWYSADHDSLLRAASSADSFRESSAATLNRIRTQCDETSAGWVSPLSRRVMSAFDEWMQKALVMQGNLDQLSTYLRAHAAQLATIEGM